VGGFCVRPDGTMEQRYVRHLPTPRLAYLHLFVDGAKAAKDEGFRRYAMLDDRFQGPTEVPQPAGGCLMVRRSLFPGRLADPRFGIYWSDVSIARQVKDRGLRCMVLPTARFLHDHDERRPAPEVAYRLSSDYMVGCVRYFRLHDGAAAARQAKRLILRGLTQRLLHKLGAVPLGREPPGNLGRHLRLMRDVLADRNAFLEHARRSEGLSLPPP